MSVRSALFRNMLVVTAMAAAIATVSVMSCSPAPDEAENVEDTIEKRSALIGTWSERGPNLSGRINGLVVDNTTSPPTWVAASPGGAVWRRSDGATTWTKPANSGLADYSVQHLEIDVLAPSRIYAATTNSLYATTNRGDSWTGLINSGGTPGALLPLHVSVDDPKPFAQHKFSSTQSLVLFSHGCFGIYYSFGGTTFTQHYPFSGGSSNLDNCIGNIVVDNISRRVYFSTLKSAAGEAAHLYRSTCAWANGAPCLTWEAANSGLPANRFVSSLASVSRSTFSNRLVALIVDNSGNTVTYTTLDGLSWTLRSTLAQGWAPRPLIWSGTGDEMFHGNVQGYHTLDRGTTWNSTWVTQQHPDVRAIFASPALGKVYMATDGNENNGTYFAFVKYNWTPGSAPTGGVSATSSGLKTWQAYHATVIPSPTASGPRRAFVGSQDNASVCTDNALTGSFVTTGVPAGGDALSIKTSPVNMNRAYARSNSGTCFHRSGNARPNSGAPSCATVQWVQVCPAGGVGAPTSWNSNIIATHPTLIDTVYFLKFNTLGYSSNAGNAFTWNPTPFNGTSIYADPSGALYLGTDSHGVYRSTDNGATWATWALNTGSPAVVMAVAKGATTGSGDTWWIASSSGLHRKIGSGAWTLLLGSGYSYSDVAVDPLCPTRVYASTGFIGGRAHHRGGVPYTTNNGASWSSLTSGFDLHNAPVSDVEVDKLESRYVYVATYGRGFWVHDWAANLPACTP